MEKKQISIGDRIIELRIANNLQQGELAKAISIHQSVLNRIEKGLRPARDAEIRSLAMFFGVSADTLLAIPAERNTIKASIKLSAEEVSMLQKFRELDERGQDAVTSTIIREYQYVV